MPIRRLRETVNMLERIDYHVRAKSTGSPAQFAKKLGVSRSSWFEYLQILTQDLGFPIVYNNYRKTYEYTQSGKFDLKFRAD